MTEEDEGALGEEIARLELEFTRLSKHPDPGVRAKAKQCLARVDKMKQVIQDGLQAAADAQARGNLD